jgi:hypothetical protein
MKLRGKGVEKKIMTCEIELPPVYNKYILLLKKLNPIALGFYTFSIGF